MINHVKHGKLFDSKHPNKNRDWVVGNFIEDPLFNTSNCEFKWQRGEKGLFREAKNVLNVNVKTLAVLAYGKVRMKFINTNVEHIIDAEGEYIMWSSDEPHEVEFLEESLILTLRWN